jgi:protein-S-isoprenylcysteine O-methyltransferase Ste14
MYMFLIPLLMGFAFNSASAFTGAYSRRWGNRRGQLASLILRNILGIPLWALGFVLASQQLSSLLFVPGPVTEILGWILIATGAVLVTWGLWFIGRRAVMPSLQDTLVCSGPYAHVRHPLHSGVLLEFFGLVLLQPTTTVLLACTVGCVWVIIQTRLEELDLLRRIPAYRQYMEQVPRFVPHLRKR